MTAGEAEYPRRNLPQTFRSVFYRLVIFFMLGALCVGILVPYTDSKLTTALSDPRPGAGSSPYVIAMENLHIPVLPSFVNFLLLTSVFSAGSSYVYGASRTLFGLALEGKAPRIFAKCTKSGVPIYCVAVTMAISLLSFLQVSDNAAVILQWCGTLMFSFDTCADRNERLAKLLTVCQVTNYAIISLTYLRFHAVNDNLLAKFQQTDGDRSGSESAGHISGLTALSRPLATLQRASLIFTPVPFDTI